MKKLLLKISEYKLVLISVAFLVILSGGCVKKDGKEIKIGAILPLTGDLAFLGEEIRKGIDIAVEEVRQEGLSLKVFYEDDQSLSPVAAVNAANKLIKSDKINIGLTMLVEESRPIAPIFNKEEVPLLVLWDSNRFIKESGVYIFSNGFSTEKAGETMARFAYARLGLRKIAIVKHVDPWAEIITESFSTEFKDLGGAIDFNETLQLGEKDYRTVITKLKNKEPDGVYLALLPPHSALFLIQAKEARIRVPLLTGDALIQDVIKTAGESAEGVYFTNIYTEQSIATALTEKYKKKYKNESLDISLASFGYDGITKVVEASKFNKSLQENFIFIFGKNRSADRIEKIYQVNKGKPIENFQINK